MPSPLSIGLWHASMAGIRASTPDSRHRAAQMGRSASKTAEAEDRSEAQAKPREASLQSETAVDASPLGQPGETTRNLTSGPKEEIDADGIDDLKLDAPHRTPLPSPALSPIARPTSPPMAPALEVSISTRPRRRQVAWKAKLPSRTRDAKHCQTRTLFDRHRSERNGWL